MVRRPLPDGGIAFGDSQQNTSSPEAVMQQCEVFLNRNLLTGHHAGYNYSFNRPSSYKYSDSQWLWDSAAHQIAWTALGKADRAIDDLRSLLRFQQDDGRIPEQINWHAHQMSWADRYKTRLLYSGTTFNDLTQIPVLPYSLRSIYNATEDVSLLEEFVPKLVAYHDWWKASRELDESGVVSILHPWESGLDLTPAYDRALGLSGYSAARPPWIKIYPQLISLCLSYNFRYRWNQSRILARTSAAWGPFNWFKVQDVAVNAVYASGWGVLGDMASVFNTSLAEYCYRHQDHFESGIVRNLYDEANRRFVTGYVDGHNRQRYHSVKTVQILFPLLLSNLTSNQVHDIVALLTDEREFWSPMPVPTVSRSEAEYDPIWNTDLLWRGPSWGFTNWFVMEGLQKHGQTHVLHELMHRWMGMVAKGGIYEMYNPETGVGYGAEGLGMSTLIVDWIRRLDYGGSATAAQGV